MSERKQLLDLRRDYDQLLGSFRQAQQGHHSRQQSILNQLTELRQQNIILRQQVEHLQLQLQQMKILSQLQDRQIKQRKQALKWAQQRCQASQQILLKMQAKIQDLIGKDQCKNQQNCEYMNHYMEINKIKQVQRMIKQTSKQIQEVTNIAIGWKDKYERLQSKRRKSKQNHPLVVRLQQMVRVCKGQKNIPSAKQSWSWIKKVVQQFMLRKKKE